MIRRHPLPTLFPYTTLFRSAALAARLPQQNKQSEKSDNRTDQRAERVSHAVRYSPGLLGREIKRTVVEDRIDRKSTRLNSSHTVISYAVFCLKKKKLNI